LARRPNVLFFHVDNLGFGELSCYSGGPFRGATTSRIDGFAAEGFRLTNYCPESQCTPTRSALLTGRHAIRSGTHSVPIGSPEGWGLVAWEKTLGDLLTDGGYACAVYGKWHVVKGPGGGRRTRVSRSGTGRRVPTTRRCGRPTRGTTRPAIRCLGWWRSAGASRASRRESS
jgi:arylsulfatase A-like enzyme